MEWIIESYDRKTDRDGESPVRDGERLYERG